MALAVGIDHRQRALTCDHDWCADELDLAGIGVGLERDLEGGHVGATRAPRAICVDAGSLGVVASAVSHGNTSVVTLADHDRFCGM